MVFSEEAYKEVYPDVKPSTSVIPKKVESMIEDDVPEDIKPEESEDPEDELIVDAPEPKEDQEGQNNDAGTDDSTN